MTGEIPSSSAAVVVERRFRVSADVLWQMWTDPEQFRAWYGPNGASVPVAIMDVRLGGRRLVCMEMETPRGTMQMWFTGEYREVSINERLVYTESMSNEHGEVISAAEAGLPAGHPRPPSSPSNSTISAITQSFELLTPELPRIPGGAVGWTQALDKLAAVIDTHR